MTKLDWEKYARLQAEELRLQQEIFEIMCSIKLMEAERNLVSQEEILTLKTKIASQQEELNKSITCQLIALNELLGHKNDCKYSG